MKVTLGTQSSGCCIINLHSKVALIMNSLYKAVYSSLNYGHMHMCVHDCNVALVLCVHPLII